MPIDEDWGNWNHQLCIVDEVAKLMDRGFTCYLEHEIPINDGQTYRNGNACHKLFVDIYAVRQREEFLIEVGSLSERGEEGRLKLLKTLVPSAKVIHVHQWKNYGINEDLVWQAGIQWRRQIDTYGKIVDPDLNPFWAGCFNEPKQTIETYNMIMNEGAKRVGDALARM